MRLWTENERIAEVAYVNDTDVSWNPATCAIVGATNYKHFPQIGEKLKQLRPGTTANPKTWSAKGYDFIHKKDYENVSLIPALSLPIPNTNSFCTCVRRFFALREQTTNQEKT